MKAVIIMATPCSNRSDRNFRATRTSRKNTERQKKKKKLHPVEAQAETEHGMMVPMHGGAPLVASREREKRWVLHVLRIPRETMPKRETLVCMKKTATRHKRGE